MRFDAGKPGMRFAVILAGVCVLQSVSIAPQATESVQSTSMIDADSIKKDCRLLFERNFYPNSTDALGNAPYDISLKWACVDTKEIFVDKYDVEGVSPEIVTVFFNRHRRIFVLVKWFSGSQAADIHGEFYKVYAYDFQRGNSTQPLRRDDVLMKRLGSGWDGIKDGRAVHFPLRDAASIRKMLARLGE